MYEWITEKRDNAGVRGKTHVVEPLFLQTLWQRWLSYNAYNDHITSLSRQQFAAPCTTPSMSILWILSIEL